MRIQNSKVKIQKNVWCQPEAVEALLNIVLSLKQRLDKLLMTSGLKHALRGGTAKQSALYK